MANLPWEKQFLVPTKYEVSWNPELACTLSRWEKKNCLVMN